MNLEIQPDLFAALIPPVESEIKVDMETMFEASSPVAASMIDGAEQAALFAADEAPIPEDARSPEPFQSVYVHFEDAAAVASFARLVGQPVNTETRRMVYPASEEFSRAWRAASAPPEEPNDDEFGFLQDDGQPNLFGEGEWWEEYWRGMPEFDQLNLAPRYTIQADFARREDVDAFAKLVGQPIAEHARRTRSIWYPEAEIGRFADKRYVATPPLNPRYPVYIVSKGRWESRFTARALEKIGVLYNIVVEPQERDQYARVIDPDKILVLPFSNLGQGSIPARNWIWEHASSTGARRHWILDDNIAWFARLNRNLKTPIADGTIFRCAEDFVDRYENVAISGFHYFMFASRKTKIPPFTLNSRVYSMILIKNDLLYRWRGRYNEDTDLSLRVLKDGWCTVLFNAFLGWKFTTMALSGGNTEALYSDDGRKKMAESVVEQHPDVARVTWKWGRWQHYVDYSRFRRNRLVPRPNATIPEGVNDYGMRLVIDDSFRKVAVLG